MVKGRGAMHLDGDFSRDFPVPERFSIWQAGHWTVVMRGPRYINTYEIVEFDADGRAWLERIQRTE